MSDMVERIARAIYEERNGRGCKAWGNLSLSHRGCYELDARAALEAIRIPTREMLQSANAAGSPESPALPHEVWPVMIDAAIGKTSD